MCFPFPTGLSPVSFCWSCTSFIHSTGLNYIFFYPIQESSCFSLNLLNTHQSSFSMSCLLLHDICHLWKVLHTPALPIPPLLPNEDLTDPFLLLSSALSSLLLLPSWHITIKTHKIIKNFLLEKQFFVPYFPVWIIYSILCPLFKLVKVT